MCCEAEWKREVVQDHKWDFINVTEFRKTDFMTRLKYVWRYILLFKSMTVYGLDIFTAVTMISSDRWTNAITAKGSEGIVEVKFIIAKWVFVGCIIFSFLLLGYESFKARQVIKSRDISYAFTNVLANDYFSFKSYDNFCLFCHIDESTKKKDDFAFFIFFTFKEWKRLLLADGPRQSINGLMLYSFGQAYGWQTSNIPAYWNEDPITAMLLFSMIATVLIFAGSMVLLIAAAVLYVPLLCYIQGNLKEYVCHKVDKRLSELVKKKQRLRAQRAAALEKKLARDGGLRNSKGEFVNVVMQPTLPKINLDDEDLRETKTGMIRSKSGDTLKAYPTSVIPGNHEVYDAYGGYSPTLEYPQHPGMYSADSYGSSTNLLDTAGPMGISYPPPVSAAPSFPPRSASPNPPIHPSRSNTQLSGFSSHSHQTAFTPSALTPGLPYPSQSAFDRPSPPMPSAYPQPFQHPRNPYAPSLQIPSNGYRHQGEQVLSPSALSYRRQSVESGLAYDRTDTDLDSVNGPAPSYHSNVGSPPRRLGEKGHQGYGGYGYGR